MWPPASMGRGALAQRSEGRCFHVVDSPHNWYGQARLIAPES